MDFTDDAIVLSARRHGEANLVLSALTKEHGRHLGLVKGGASRRQRPNLEIGNRLKLVWHARLEEQLGSFTVEPLGSVSAQLLDQPLRLAGLASACAVADIVLPEREPHEDVFAATATLIAAIAEGAETWAAGYVRWELALLASLGFGLDLSRCAATGETENLAYVSPKSGRAVGRAAGEGYRDRLLPLPSFLISDTAPGRDDILAGLRLTGYFLDRHVLHGPVTDRRLEARARFLERLAAPS
ncbi:MAG TPA: DNA repair protein RecO [Dongiaceae bacterium]|nr:DNA repair protein RecO [Dongiaceae bacterium]